MILRSRLLVGWPLQEQRVRLDAAERGWVLEPLRWRVYETIHADIDGYDDTPAPVASARHLSS